MLDDSGIGGNDGFFNAAKIELNVSPKVAVYLDSTLTGFAAIAGNPQRSATRNDGYGVGKITPLDSVACVKPWKTARVLPQAVG